MPSKKRYSINHIHDGFKLGTYKPSELDTKPELQDKPQPTQKPMEINTADNFNQSSSSSTPSSSQASTAKSKSSKKRKTGSIVSKNSDKQQIHHAPDSAAQSIKKPIKNLLATPDILNDTLQLSSLLIDARRSMIKDFANPNYNSLDHSIKTHNLHELKTGGGKLSTINQTDSPNIDESKTNPMLNETQVSELKKGPTIGDNGDTSMISQANKFLLSSPSCNEKLEANPLVRPPEYYLDQTSSAINPVTHLPYNSSKLIIPTMATLNRAEKVKAIFGSYYWYLNRYVAHYKDNPGELVWDPLEFIRIREGSSHHSNNANKTNKVNHGYSTTGRNKEVLHRTVSEVKVTSSKALIKKDHANHHHHLNYNHPFVWKFTIDDIIASYHIYLNTINSINVPRRNNSNMTSHQQGSSADIEINKKEIEGSGANSGVTNDSKNQKVEVNMIQEEPAGNIISSASTDISKNSNNIQNFEEKDLGRVTPKKLSNNDALTPIHPVSSALVSTMGPSNLSLTKTSESSPDININQISFVSRHSKQTHSSKLPHHLHIHYENHNANSGESPHSPVAGGTQDNSNYISNNDKHRNRLLKSIPYHYRQKSSKSSVSSSPSNINHQGQSPSICQASKTDYFTNEVTNSIKGSTDDNSLENIAKDDEASSMPADVNLLPAFSNAYKKNMSAQYDFKSSSSEKKLFASDDTVHSSPEMKTMKGASKISSGNETSTDRFYNDMQNSSLNEQVQDFNDEEFSTSRHKKSIYHKGFESLDDLRDASSHNAYKLPPFHSKGFLNSTPTSFKNSYQYISPSLAADPNLTPITKGSNLNNSTPVINYKIQKPIISVTNALPSQSGSYIMDDNSADKVLNGKSGASLDIKNFDSNEFLSPNIKFTKIRANSSLGLRKFSDNINSSSSSSTGTSYQMNSNMQPEIINGEVSKNQFNKKSKRKNGKSHQKRKQDARNKKKSNSVENENESLLCEIYNAIQVGSTHLSVIDNHLDVVKYKYDSLFEFSKNVNFTVNIDHDEGDESFIEMETNSKILELSSKQSKLNKPSIIATSLKQNEYLVSFISSLLPIYLDIYAKANENLSILKARLNSTQQSLKIEKLLSMSDRLILNLNTKVALNYKQISDRHKLILQNKDRASNIWKCFVFKIAEYSIIVGLYILWVVLSIIRIVWKIFLGESFSK